jgi:hypothetical protein
VPQLKDDYKKAYDKLTYGPALSQFIGYSHFSDNRLYNYRIGFELEGQNTIRLIKVMHRKDIYKKFYFTFFI